MTSFSGKQIERSGSAPEGSHDEFGGSRSLIGIQGVGGSRAGKRSPRCDAEERRTSPDREVGRYLLSGEVDPLYLEWPGNNVFEGAVLGEATLRWALVFLVVRRTPRAGVPEVLRHLDVGGFGRERVAPMVRGLFTRSEQETVLDVLGQSASRSSS